MKLLFVTHKIHENDDDFAFAILWVKEFMRQGYDVDVICLEKQDFSGGFSVYSLGKEKGWSTAKSLLYFWQIILKLKYDRVFVHMNPKWAMAGALYWKMKKIPVYLWYTHYTTHIPLKVSHWLCKRLFCATVESMPQYEGDHKKVVTGHGVDTAFWQMELLRREERKPKYDLLSVHRICRSKRPHLAIEALTYLPEEYNLTIYGRVLEDDYNQELKELIFKLGVGGRVKFLGPVPMPELRGIYPHYQIMINMAPETIDKTVIEGLLAGVEPITTKGNAKAIGLPSAPEDNPRAIAEYVLRHELLPMETLRKIAQEKHSLEALVKKMNEYIKYGK